MKINSDKACLVCGQSYDGPANSKACSPSCKSEAKRRQGAERNRTGEVAQYDGPPSPAGWEEARKAVERIRKGATR